MSDPQPKPEPDRTANWCGGKSRAAYQRAWRAANLARSRAHMAAFRERNLEKCRAKSRYYARLYNEAHPGDAAARSRQQRAKLSRSYIARNILGVPTKECPEDLIEFTRAYIQLQRELRNNPR